MRPVQISVIAFGLVFLFACSHAPTKTGELRSKTTPDQLLSSACSPGQGVREVRGEALMKAKSSDASGQFPADIEAKAPADLKLEVTHPLGGTAAILTVHGSDYRIVVPGKPERGRQGRDSWGGIPLKWATELFLGKIPCPDPALKDRYRLSITDENELVAEAAESPTTPSEKFIYTFDENKGAYWPKTLHWETASAAVDFDFEDPDAETRSPLKWQARSKRGEVKIRWREREIVH